MKIKLKEIKEESLRDVYGETLLELGRENKKIVVLDSDLSASTKTNLFAREFPERFFNMGVAEQDMIGTAAGLALGGMIPFVSSFAVFEAGRAWEQIRQSICYPNLNVKLVASHGGITVGEDGATHQSNEDLALMRILPNMKVICPCDAVETRKIIISIAEDYGPCYVRLSRPKFPVILDDDYSFEIGKSFILMEGDDIAIFAIGITLFHSLIAAEELAKEGIHARVANLSSIKPIDEELIVESAKKTKAVLTVEEHSIFGGLGSAVAEVLSQNYPCFIKIMGIPDTFGISGKPHELLDFYGISSPYIYREAVNLLKKKKEKHGAY
ncbi:MAG: transketolase family protein [Acidobacteriota bacterium]